MRASTPHSAPERNPQESERTLSVEEVLGVLWRGLAPMTIATLGVYLLVWGWPSASPSDWVTGGLWMLLAYLVAILAHEALHILPMLVFGVRLRDLRFGIRWRDGVVFVHAGRPVTARQYRIILAVPGVVLGLIPAAVGIASGHAFLTFFGYLLLVSAVGDWAVLRLIRDLPPDARVMDHPSEVGCIVVGDG